MNGVGMPIGLCVVLGSLFVACSLQHSDYANNRCKSNLECFVAQGEYCNTEIGRCQPLVDAAAVNDAQPRPDATAAADANPTPDGAIASDANTAADGATLAAERVSEGWAAGAETRGGQ